MKSGFALAVSLSWLLACGGCAYKQMQVSQEGIREVLLDLYQDQVMDNLIRTKNNLPIMQLAYSNAVGQVTNTAALGANGGQSSQANGFGGLATNYSFLISGSGFTGDQISITADPVMKPSVAKAYADYAAKIKLVTSDSKPKSESCHIARKFNGLYYYISRDDTESQVAFVGLYNEVSQAEAPKPSKAFDQLLNEESKQRLNEMIR